MPALIVRRFSERQDYLAIWQQMQQFTAQRDAATTDELWLLEHHPIYTLGLAGDSDNLLSTGATPVLRTDRGGQVTWHGPGQWMLYTLLDAQRLRLGVRALVSVLENVVIDSLAAWGLSAFAKKNAPGVYVFDGAGADAKIAALGLRVTRKGCYHGIALNVSCDLQAFSGIHPCGHAGQHVTRLLDCLPVMPTRAALEKKLIAAFTTALGYTQVFVRDNEMWQAHDR
ncbi:MAG: lipoyl(octanoyl) transferase LipB [Pseudomonadales bacterium]|nr:lipoyl(octanoyl) transferase LipB [Pseudomonadales bacterium]